MKKNKKDEKYEFVGKCLYFPKLKLLAVGDLHMGYEAMLKKQGISVPLNQTKKTLEELKEIFDFLSKTKRDVKQIVLLGDIKHYFSFNVEEENSVNRILEFLRKKRGVICIRGNHDKMKIAGIDFQDFYIKNNVVFVHGYKAFKEIYDKNINLIVMSHIHPTVVLRDEQKIKSEKYKCFLKGKLKGKNVVVVPSFFSLSEGANIEDIDGEENFSIIPSSKLENFEVFVPNNFEVLSFGKIRNL